MKNIVLVAAAGLMALAGAAMADQAILVDGSLHTPAGDVPIEQNTGGIPIPDASLPVGDATASLNGALGEDSPAEVQDQEQGLRPNIKCSALSDLNHDGLLDKSCQEEPTFTWVDSDYVAVGPDGAELKQWAEVDSGEVFTYLPEDISSQVPEDQKQALADANDQVNARAAASMVDESQRHPTNARPRFFGGTDELLQSGKLKGLLAGLGFGPGLIGDGAEELYVPEGFDELFRNDAPGLQSSTEGGDHGIAGSEGELGGSGGSDFAAMALTAAVVGGALLAPMALYHRIRSNNALNNKTRQMVYDAVVRSPGLGVNDAAKAATCSYSTAAYHLERLVEERLLIVSEDGRRARYFKNGGAFTQSEREFVPILQSQECMNVLTTIVENPWCYRAEVAQKLGVSGPTVNWHLKKLMTAGVVKEMREGRVSYLYADKKVLTNLGANLIGKLPDDLVARLRFEHKPETEFVEPAASLPETTVPEVGLGEYDGIELAPLSEAKA